MDIQLKEGEVICPKCHGSGNRAEAPISYPDYRIYLKCVKCHGTGKLDWIEAVVGKKSYTLDTIRVRDYGIMVKPDASCIISGNVS